MSEILLENQVIHWTLKHSSRRRTVQIRVTGPDSVQVTAPKGYSEAMAEKLLRQKAAWLLRHMQRLETAERYAESLTLSHGTHLLFQGDSHTLLLLADGGKRPHVSCCQAQITVHLQELIGDGNHPQVIRTLQLWYWQQAKEKLEQRTAYWSDQMKLRPRRLCLRDQKSRWGSCSSTGTINYNWRLIMAPPEVLDYVVIHELCHLQHPNHSDAFWQSVSCWCPQYRLHRRWLKENGLLLGKLFFQ